MKQLIPLLALLVLGVSCTKEENIQKPTENVSLESLVTRFEQDVIRYGTHFTELDSATIQAIQDGSLTNADQAALPEIFHSDAFRKSAEMVVQSRKELLTHYSQKEVLRHLKRTSTPIQTRSSEKVPCTEQYELEFYAASVAFSSCMLSACMETFGLGCLVCGSGFGAAILIAEVSFNNCLKDNYE